MDPGPGYPTPAIISVPVPIMAPLSPRKIKIHKPKKYNGDRIKFNKFKTQLTLSFTVNPGIFKEKSNKIIYIILFFRGPAAN